MKPGFQSPSSALGARESIAPDAPVPVKIILRVCSKSRPLCCASESASAMPTMEDASAIWLASLADWPLPAPPSRRCARRRSPAARGPVRCRARCARDGSERAGDGTGLATRHRAVERRAVAHRCSLGDIARKRGRARGEVDENGTGLGGREQAVARQVELLDILGITHHREDDVRIAHCLCGRGRPRRLAPRAAAPWLRVRS